MNETANISLAEAIAAIDSRIKNPSIGLPDEVFYFISRTTPLVNVDLLVKDENGRMLLAWRDDKYCGKGWHIPGGIIRFKETFETRIKKVALAEIGVMVSFDPKPIDMLQLIHPESDIRGHFISFLYNCRLPGSFVPDNKGRTEKDPGFLKWHERCPDDLLRFHAEYRKHMT